MTDLGNNQLIADVTRDIIAQTAPQELPLFRAISEAYIKDPDRVLNPQTSKEEKLSFGVGDAVTILTPIALAAVTEVLKYIGERLVKTAKEEGAEVASNTVKRLFKKFQSEERDCFKSTPYLSQEHMIQIRRIVLEKARQLRLSEAQSEMLADAVVGSLATAS